MIALLLSLLAAGAAPASPMAASPEVPHSVVLVDATPQSRERAHSALAQLLGERSPEGLAAAFADSSPGAGRPPLLLGNFVSRDLLDSPGFDPERTARGEGQVPLTKDVPLHYELVGAATVAQREYIAQRLHAMLPSGAPATIRPATFDELARIWYFIGWDLDEPLLVAEWNDHAFAFDFDAAGGHITWIERLNDPCFSLGTREKRLLDCHCLVVHREGQRWQALFEPKPQSCPK